MIFFDHINIVVTDMERSVTFYRDVLGFLVSKNVDIEGEWLESIVGLSGVKARVTYLELDGGGPKLELLEYLTPQGKEIPECSEPNTVGIRHLAICVDDIEAMFLKLEKNKIETLSPPVSLPPEVTQKGTGHKKVLYFYDPDRVLLELTEHKPK